MGVVRLSEKVVTKRRDILQSMKNHIHIVIGLYRESTPTSFPTLLLTLILFSPTMPGRYLLPSSAKDSLEVLSRFVTASLEKTGFRTNCRQASIHHFLLIPPSLLPSLPNPFHSHYLPPSLRRKHCCTATAAHLNILQRRVYDLVIVRKTVELESL